VAGFSTIPFAETHMDIPSISELTQISNYEDINHVLLSQKFIQGGFQLAGRELIPDAILLLDGKRHIKRRGIMSRTLSDGHVAALRESYLKPTVAQCLREIADSGPSADGSVRADLVMLAQRSIHRIAAAISGVDGADDLPEVDRLVSLIKRIAAGIQVQFSREPADVVLADAKKALRAFNDEYLAASREKRLAIVNEVKAGRKNASELPQDLLTQTLTHTEDAWDGDDELPLREIAHFMVGATQTTAGALVIFILRLEEWLSAHPQDRKLIESDPNFLRNAAFESLRLTVGAPARLRTATEEVTLPSGLVVDKGQTIALLFIPANMSKSRFGEDADTYNPHRDVGKLTPWGFAFSAGVHACPGRPLVTGNRSMKAQTAVDGTMVTIARRLYRAGMALDPDHPPVPESATHYSIFREVPIRFTRPEGLIESEADEIGAPAPRHAAV
jgi:cytochrome P450